MKKLAIVILTSMLLLGILWSGRDYPLAGGFWGVGRDAGYSIFLPLVLRIGRSTLVFEFDQADAEGRSVAFYSLEFIDLQARTIQTVTFGTPEANALQGTGWYANQSDAEVGVFQWAGGPEKKATLDLLMPVGTAGLLLYTRAYSTELTMDVRIDGNTAATLRVTDQLVRRYVPIAPPQPAVVPDLEPAWTTGRFYPTFPETNRLYAIRVRSALEDWWGAPAEPSWRINQDYDSMMALTLVGMQGVINRHGPVVYLDWEDQGRYGDAARFWLSPLSEDVEIVYLDIDGSSAFRFLYERYSTYFTGAVIYDPALPDTINLATTLAGLEDRIMVAPEQLDQTGMPAFASTTDLRTPAAQYGWDNTPQGRTDQYQWLYTNAWPQLEKRIIGLVSPGPPVGSSEVEPGDNRSFPVSLASRDYIVALRLAALYLSPTESPEQELFARFMADTSSPLPLYSFYDGQELGTVAFAARLGDVVAVITNPNTPLSGGNMSVFSGVPAEPERYVPRIDDEHLLAALGDRPIMTLWSSDGDAVQVIHDRGFGTGFSWDTAKDRSFGWTINPTVVELAPTIWNHYIDPQAPAGLVYGLSGAGYTYPPLMDSQQLRTYLEYTADYIEETGLRVLFYDTRYGPTGRISHAAAALYHEILTPAALLGIFAGDTGWPWGFGFYYAGVPMPVVRPSYNLWDGTSQAVIDDLLARKPDEIFVDPAGAQMTRSDQEIYGWQNGTVVDDPDADRGQALVFSRPDMPDCCAAVWGPHSALAPGEYTIAYRLKVEDIGSSESIARLYVTGNQADTDTELAQQALAPRDFAVADQYQAFTLTVTLDQFATDVGFNIDYYGGTGTSPDVKLYVDTVLAKRHGDLSFPVIGAISMVPTGISLQQRLSITDEFERRGGLVLTPDELMATLNPTYMIEWATPILGSDHPALTEAQALLEQSKFFESLSTVRVALRNQVEQ